MWAWPQDYCPPRLVVGGGVTGLVNGLLGISGSLSSDVFLTLELAPVSYIASDIGSDNGCGIGCAMILGNFIAMRFIRNVNKKLYQKMVAGIMIAVSLWLIVSQII